MLDCDLVWCVSSFTSELGTDVGLVSTDVTLSWPDALDLGLDGGLFELYNPAVSSLALKLTTSFLQTSTL